MDEDQDHVIHKVDGPFAQMEAQARTVNEPPI